MIDLLPIILIDLISNLEKRTRQIMSSILNAVNHLHSHRVVHRDLKPEK